MSALIELHTPEQAAHWLRERVTGQLRVDSREIQAGDGFIAWPGAATDARQHVANALAGAAQACLVEREDVAPYHFIDPRIATYLGLKRATAPIAAAYFEQPSTQLKVLAVTGTNGKTTSAWWLAQALSRVQKRCGLMGTLGIGEVTNLQPNGLTTPHPVLLQQALRRFVDQGFATCALEASSIGLAEHRLDGTAIAVAICTNFTQDHLDYHGDMQTYWQAKKRLFTWPGLQAAVINQDDDTVAELVDVLDHTKTDVWTLSCRQSTLNHARLQAHNIVHSPEGLCFDVVEGSARHHLSTPWIGRYNAANLLGVIASLRSLDIPLEQAVQACTDLVPVPGRMQTIAQMNRPLIVVDYAHTPDALEKVLQALQDVASTRTGQLWCVFGCGGERDCSKRPMMAAVAEAHADYVVVTSDNPRSENPLNIISQILLGLSHRDGVHVEADRAQAIAHAVTQARPQDVVLVAGKGHETTQEIGGHSFAFSDLQQAHAALQSMASK